MTIKVNGKDVTLEKEVTVKELLEIQKVEMPDYVTVQINDKILDRKDFETLTVKEATSWNSFILWEAARYEFYQ